MKSRITTIVAYRWGNPFQFKQTVDAEMYHQHRSRGSPGQGPHRDPRDSYVLVSTIIGIVLCSITGVIIGANVAGFGGVFLGLVAGILIGGFGGLYVGELLKRRHIRKLDSKTNPEEPDRDSQGPFIK